MRRAEFLWAVGGEERLRQSLERIFANEFARIHGVRLEEREVRTFAAFVPSVADAWARAGAETESRSPERFLEERAAEFVRELDVSGLIAHLRKREVRRSR